MGDQGPAGEKFQAKLRTYAAGSQWVRSRRDDGRNPDPSPSDHHQRFRHADAGGRIGILLPAPRPAIASAPMECAHMTAKETRR